LTRRLRIRLPKRIAGAKIPKTVRTGPLPEFLNSSAGQIVIAEMLLAASALFAAHRLDPDAPEDVLGSREHLSTRALTREVVLDGTSDRLVRAARAAVHAFRDSLYGTPSIAGDRVQLESVEPKSEVGPARTTASRSRVKKKKGKGKSA
jgi:hypothetical protein